MLNRKIQNNRTKKNYTNIKKIKKTKGGYSNKKNQSMKYRRNNRYRNMKSNLKSAKRQYSFV